MANFDIVVYGLNGFMEFVVLNGKMMAIVRFGYSDYTRIIININVKGCLYANILWTEW